MPITTSLRSVLTGVLVAASLFAGACGSDGGSASSDGGTSDAGNGGPLYGLVSVVFSDDGRTTYVSLFDSLDVDGVDLADAREYPGLASVAAHDGKLYVADGEAPTVVRYSGNRTWDEEGRVDFGHYTSSVDLAANIFVAPDKAYQLYDIAARAFWDPAELAIDGTGAAPVDLPFERDGLSIRQGYRHAVQGHFAFQPFYWSDDDFFVHGATSSIAVFDTNTDNVAGLLETSCPGLSIVSEDEQGNVYLSNGSSSVIPRLFSTDAPQNCLARIKAGEQVIDEAWTRHFADLTEGREAATFQYFGGGKGFIQVFHDEDVTITPDSDPYEVSASEHWRIWVLDLSAGTAAPMEGIGFFGGQYAAFAVDGRTFFLLPAADYATTKVYEVTSDGTAVERFVADGFAYNLLRVR